jgi:hypothetical protein
MTHCWSGVFMSLSLYFQRLHQASRKKITKTDIINAAMKKYIYIYTHTHIYTHI